MDIEEREYQTIEELLDYCYCVAGTVGLMMCHIMGLSRPEALDNAVNMGNAMQLTNISRDVLDDWNLGRIYFPKQWLQEYGLTRENFNLPDNRRLWALMTKRLLSVADKNYSSGWRGLNALPFRAAWAVAVAGQVYSRIGSKVLKKQEKAWEQRCYVTLPEKILISISTTFILFIRFLPRLFTPWKAKPINRIWSQT
jgi:phytoene synthase